MANERLFQFPSKASPVAADIIYVGDSANGFNEVQSTIAQIIAVYPNLSGIAGLTLGANTYPYSNNSSVLTAGTITALAVSLLADTTIGAMQSTLGLVIGTNVQAHNAALDSIAALTTVANNLIYTTALNTYAVIAPVASAVLVTSAGSVPSLSTVLPAGLTMASDPTTNLGIATRQYVDLIATGGGQPCFCATTASLNITYNNGASGVGATITDAAGTFLAFSVDGQSPSVNARVLIKNQASTFQNGVYILTTNGDGISVPYVLTRATDYDTVNDINDTGLIPVINGTANGNTGWYNTTPMVAVGTTAVTFVKFGSTGTVTSVATSTGLTGGTITTTGTISLVTPFAAGTVVAKSAVLATTSGLANVTGDGTAYTILFETATVDRNSDYNTGTGVFTAPQDGLYQVIVMLDLSGVAADNTICELDIKKNGVAFYTPYQIGDTGTAKNNTGLSFTISMLVHLVATDTLSCLLTVSGHATKNIGVAGDSHFGVYYVQ